MDSLLNDSIKFVFSEQRIPSAKCARPAFAGILIYCADFSLRPHDRDQRGSSSAVRHRTAIRLHGLWEKVRRGPAGLADRTRVARRPARRLTDGFSFTNIQMAKLRANLLDHLRTFAAEVRADHARAFSSVGPTGSELRVASCACLTRSRS
jgi:hypothetical protein